MNKINYIKGDATKPIGEGHKIIAHVCNDIGKWGKGFVLAISKKWKKPELEYKELFDTYKIALGSIFEYQVEDDISVVNMIAQNGIQSNINPIPLNYEMLELCLDKLVVIAIKSNSSIHMPKIGCGLAGGEWSKVEKLILNKLCNKNIDVYVYEL